ncbi:MAG: glycosyltransferase [Pontiellaceae bacterium]|nr:glycosyltransferase [Pontiellaceae bacterium]MBN2783919.1 glycosyltransferase [Pontiellaceae bacterium]
METDNVLVSIVIPAYNAAGIVKKAIDSVLAQTYRPLEIIVIDDGSTDETGRVCRGYGDCIQYVYQSNQGASAARNHGIRLARGEYIGFLDSDDHYLPEKISELVGLFEEFPEAGAVTGAFIQKTEAGERITPEPGLVFGDDEIQRGIIDYFMCEYRGCWVVHTNTILIRRQVLKLVGSFNESYRFGEDVDLWCRIAGQYPIAYVDQVVAYYDRCNEHSLCANSSVLGHGVDFLYDRSEERRLIRRSMLSSYRLFKNKILFARLMLSIYERNRGMLYSCLRKLRPFPLNIRILIALLVIPLPVCFWPRNK